MLTHKNIVSNLLDGKASFPFPDAPDYKALSFCHSIIFSKKNVSYIYLFGGISIYYAESLDSIGDNLKEVMPDMFDVSEII